jgi:hypothetical protein
MKFKWNVMRNPAVAALAVAGCQKDGAPDRPKSVPPDAVWAGGADGGAWIHCAAVRQGKPGRFFCKLFDDQAGKAWASGRFLLEATGSQGPAAALAAAATMTVDDLRDRYDAFDGERILLDGGFALVPDGTITYPIDDRSGKKIRFDRGRRLDETEYKRQTF